MRNTRVLARHAHRALRSGQAPAEVAPAVGDLARSVWALAASYDEPERADEARDLASRAAAGTETDALGESVRSTAVDLMRAAELVSGAPDELPTEELLLGIAPRDDDVDVPWVATIAERRSSRRPGRVSSRRSRSPAAARRCRPRSSSVARSR